MAGFFLKFLFYILLEFSCFGKLAFSLAFPLTSADLLVLLLFPLQKTRSTKRAHSPGDRRPGFPRGDQSSEDSGRTASNWLLPQDFWRLGKVFHLKKDGSLK